MRDKKIKRKKNSFGTVQIRKKRLFFLLTFILLIAVVFSGIRLLGSYQSIQNKAEWAVALRDASQSEGINYVIYGFSGEGSDIFIEELFFLNFSSPDLPPQIFFIPGEVLLHRLQNEDEAVNGLQEADENLISFYTPSNFYHEGGAKLLIEQISLFLDAPVHHYLEVNYEGIPDIVDNRGKISYNGYTLQGKDYFDYFMHVEEEDEPLDRALHRARMLGSLVDFLGEAGGIFSTPKLIKDSSPYLKTDLSWKELKNFYKALGPLFKPEQLVITLPGSWRQINGGDLYFEPDNSIIAEMMASLGQELILPRQVITVEVLNGSGIPGIASQAGELLHKEGFQVVNIDNADHFDYQQSQVISRIDDINAAKDIAVIIPGAELVKDPLPEYPAMVTVILGRNFSL